jgi:hypothetical protein
MNDSTRVRRLTWPTTRTANAIIAGVGVAVLAPACSGSARSHAAQHGSSRAAIAFARCMRSHGVPNYPDPSSSNELPSGLPKVIPQAVGVSNSQFLAATNACRHLYPKGAQPTPAENQQTLSRLVKFAQCMRSHGVSNWPDPERVSVVGQAQGGSPYQFDLQGLQGLDGRSFPPRVTTAMHACLHQEHLTDVAWT